MDTVELLPLIMRWLHILPAIVAVGGIAFIWLVLSSAIRHTLEEEQANQLRERIKGRWKRIVHVSILLFLISGIYNYFRALWGDPAPPALYHMLFGIKFLLALGVFFLASALNSSREWAAQFRKQTWVWTGVTLVLAVVVVLVSGYMRLIPTVVELPANASVTEEAND